MDLIAPGLSLIALVFGLTSLVLLVVALIHVLTNKSKSSTDKILWVILIFLFPILGPILYFVIGR